MRIRDATFDDLERMMALALEAHDRSPLGHVNPVPSEMQRTFVVTLAAPDGYARVVEEDGTVISCLVGIVARNHMGIRCAHDLLTNGRGGIHLLLKDFRRWAVAHGAKYIQITDMGDNHRYRLLIERLGFKPCGQTFIGA